MNEVREAFGRYGYAALILLHCTVFIISVLYVATPWLDEECWGFGYWATVGYILNYLWYFFEPSIEEKKFSETVLISGTGIGLNMHIYIVISTFFS